MNIAPQFASKRLELLIEQIATRRDHAAFAELYAATKGKLFSTIVSIVRRRDLAEEIIQEAFVRVWLNASSYRLTSGSPMTWMITIARNLAIDTIRKSSREIHSDDSILMEIPSDCPNAFEIIEAEQSRRTESEQVLAALQTLDPARRDLIIAAYIHGASREQLSKRAGVPVNTVKTWIRRALLEVEGIIRNTRENPGVNILSLPNLGPTVHPGIVALAGAPTLKVDRMPRAVAAREERAPDMAAGL